MFINSTGATYLTIDAAIKSILEGNKVSNEADLTFKEVHFDKESRYFIYSIQGVESMRDRNLVLTVSDLKSKEWKTVDIRTSTT